MYFQSREVLFLFTESFSAKDESGFAQTEIPDFITEFEDVENES